MSTVPSRLRSPFFSFDTETGSRRPRWVAFVAGLVTVLLALTGVAVGVGAANAHTPRISADCYGLKVDLQSYNTSGDNSVKVVINGTTVEEIADFGGAYSRTFAFDDPTVENVWSVVVVAHDDPTRSKGWSVKLLDQKTTPCAAPTLDLVASVCNTVGGTTDLTATIGSLLPAATYSGQLYKNGVAEGPVFPVSAGQKSWTGMEAGVTYRLTVWHDAKPAITKSIETFAIGCPQNSDLSVQVTQCTSTSSSNASVSVTASSLVPGRMYTAVAKTASTVYDTIEFTPGAGITSMVFALDLPATVSGLFVVLTDKASGTETTSTTFSTAACPSQPSAPAVQVQECTEVGGDLEIVVTLDGLTPGREYLVAIDGVVVDTVTAGASTQGGLGYPVTAGTHTVTVSDKLVPAISATSEPFEVEACPTQPDVAFQITECSEPGGTGTLTATLDGLGVGRDYSVTLTADNAAVPGYPTTTVTAGAAPIVYSGLPPGPTYTVTVVDLAEPSIKDAASATLEACPATPQISLALECLFLEGDSLITATIDELEPGAEYRVTIEDDSAATPVTLGGVGGGLAPTAAGAPVDSATITGGATPSTVTFQVPNDVAYTVTVTAVANAAITNSAEIFAAICDLPTFPLPPGDPQLPTLALTGANPTMPMLGALGLVQFGIALLALAAMLQAASRRRRA